MPSRHLILLCLLLPACTYYRTTDPPTTADQQFLLSEATARAVEQLSAVALRDRIVFIDTTYLTLPEHNFLVAEIRARLLVSGVRLTPERPKAQVIVEVRSGGIGIDRRYYMLGLPSFAIPATGGSGGADGSAFATPEIAIVKNQKQRGYASVAFVAYLAESGELLASSGPFVGRSLREDYWLFFTGPRPTGDIPTVERRQ